ncbi:pre-mRNA-splicing factor ATP-dependent RNA helicase DHX16 [Paragonimus westermani]|uniref:Pre-mRNA-splicing factor ATP-dependent RNA helicase DHX16 n=1 Tax=Paragonimus westermani TaxID=34504 RepID=A0A5J4N5Z1_9TREM|nr:pre-mRNA-splicing factor ATP-dependent RNA helicase DHX16 [Paragonimus westermani]
MSAPPKKRCVRRRHVSESSSEEEPYDNVQAESDGLEEYEKEELDREKDIQERDAFVKRLINKDQELTRKISATPALSQYEDALRKVEAGEMSKKELLEELKKASRRSYLRKRQADKLADLKGEVEDEELFFDKDEYDSVYFISRLQRPDDKYKEEEKEKDGNEEGKRWEQEHVSSALYSFGAKDKTDKQEKYELVLDDEIDFLKALTRPGANVDEALPPEVDEEKKETSTDRREPLREVRRSLPIYKFRDSLLQAIADHQILIIEGETGSGKTTQIPQYLYETEKYELVLDDEIDFLKALTRPGANVDEALPPEVDEEKKETSTDRREPLREVRRSLPIYKFRDSLLQAIADHQILIIEGETGSGKTTQIPQYLYETVRCVLFVFLSNSSLCTTLMITYF